MSFDADQMKMTMFLLIVLMLSSCASQSIDYLDDNYSDRLQLAREILGEQAIYFDLSRYDKQQAQLVDSSQLNLSKFHMDGDYQILSTILKKLASSGEGKIAVSGIPIGATARQLELALQSLKDGEAKHVKLLYIGAKRYKKRITYLANRKGLTMRYAKMPRTSLD